MKTIFERAAVIEEYEALVSFLTQEAESLRELVLALESECDWHHIPNEEEADILEDAHYFANKIKFYIDAFWEHLPKMAPIMDKLWEKQNQK